MVICVNVDLLRKQYELEKDNSFDEILEVKNYKVLCEILNEPEKKGKSRQLQLKDWSRYFDFIQEKQKFVIKEVYNKPLPKTKQNPFDILNELIICNKLVEHMEKEEKKKTSESEDNNETEVKEDKRYVCSMFQLAQDLGYVNDLFKEYYEHRRELIEDINLIQDFKITDGIKKRGKTLSKLDIGNKYRLNQLRYDSINEVYKLIPKRYKDRIEKTLNRLKDECIINVNIVDYGLFAIPDESKLVSVTSKNQHGDNVTHHNYGIKKEYRPLTDIEANRVQSIKRKILKELDCEEESDVYAKQKNYIFESKLSEALLELNLLNVSTCYVLAFAEDYIKEKRDEVLKKYKTLDKIFPQRLNQLFLERSLKNSENMAIRRKKNVENDMLLSEDEKKKQLKYYNKEQLERDNALNYLLSFEAGESFKKDLENKKEELMKNNPVQFKACKKQNLKFNKEEKNVLNKFLNNE